MQPFIVYKQARYFSFILLPNYGIRPQLQSASRTNVLIIYFTYFHALYTANYCINIKLPVVYICDNVCNMYSVIILPLPEVLKLPQDVHDMKVLHFLSKSLLLVLTDEVWTSAVWNTGKITLQTCSNSAFNSNSKTHKTRITSSHIFCNNLFLNTGITTTC